MVKMLIDERNLIRRGKKLIFTVHQEQEYSEELRQNLLKAWNKELKEKKAWLKNFKKHEASAMELAKKELNAMREKIEQDVKNIEEGLNTWENVKDEI